MSLADRGLWTEINDCYRSLVPLLGNIFITALRFRFFFISPIYLFIYFFALFKACTHTMWPWYEEDEEEEEKMNRFRFIVLFK